ncbi:uncharacterized protein METZ01_LOCUS287301, partial [marine metagenome]
ATSVPPDLTRCRPGPGGSSSGPSSVKPTAIRR